MDIIRESLTTIVDRFQYETSVEHFVLPAGMNPPTADDYNKVAPYFNAYGVSPQDAFAVLMFFDKDPASLPKKDVESRIKMLNILLKMLNDPATSGLILQNYKQMLGKDMPADQQENAKGMLNLLKRLITLLILEANQSQAQIVNDSVTTSDQSSNSAMIVIGIVVIVAVILMKK